MGENLRDTVSCRSGEESGAGALRAAREAIRGAAAVEVSLDSLRGPEDWPLVYGAPGLFHVEIGAGRDTLLLELGRQLPDRLMLGFEYSRDRVERLSRKIERAGVANVRLVRSEALQCIARFLPAESVESFYVFFPDPWPKKRHEDKRLVSGPSVRLLASRLVPGGRIFLKTDDPAYSRRMLDVLEKAPFLRNEYGPGSFAPFQGPLSHETLYERKWRAQGRCIYSLVYVRTSAP
ncbi:MAG TPA: hypothetical protein DCM87_04595 [Planctomycetes bacterium]|nr:hypothetical protein [Planctomycetota bacterium]